MTAKSTSRKTTGSGRSKVAKTKTKKKKAVKKTPARAAAKKVAKKKAPKKVAPKKKVAKKKAAKSTAAARQPTRRTKTPKAAPTAARRRVRTRGVPVKLRKFHDKLLDKQRELMAAYIESTGNTRSRFDDGTEDYIDYAVNSYAKEFILSLTEMERSELLLVQEALRRIERNEFGRCMQCGVEIPLRRLEVLPWVRYCIRCQELEDQGLLPQRSFADEGLEREDAASDDIDEDIDIVEPDEDGDDEGDEREDGLEIGDED